MKLSTQNLFKFMIAFTAVALILLFISQKYTKRTVVLTDENGNKLTGEIQISSSRSNRKTNPTPTPDVVDAPQNS
jgi:hypothetical protein